MSLWCCERRRRLYFYSTHHVAADRRTSSIRRIMPGSQVDIARMRRMSEQGAEGLTTAISEKGGYLRLDLKEEYYKIVDIVTGFDQRLLTIKGWGVTFSLATAALGFNYGLLLIAAASALAFWIVEASVKRHQMRYYPRMGMAEKRGSPVMLFPHVALPKQCEPFV
jgi:hypothetical protein